MEHRRSGAVAGADKGFRAVQLYRADHVARALLGKRAVLHVDDDVIQTGKTQTFRRHRSPDMAECACHSLPGRQFLIEHAHAGTLAFRIPRIRSTASFRLSMELAYDTRTKSCPMEPNT